MNWLALVVALVGVVILLGSKALVNSKKYPRFSDVAPSFFIPGVMLFLIGVFGVSASLREQTDFRERNPAPGIYEAREDCVNHPAECRFDCLLQSTRSVPRGMARSRPRPVFVDICTENAVTVFRGELIRLDRVDACFRITKVNIPQ